MDAKIITDQKAETMIFTSENHDKEKRSKLEDGGYLSFMTSGSKTVDLNDVAQILVEKLVSSVLIEGGGTVSASFLEAGLMINLSFIWRRS